MIKRIHYIIINGHSVSLHHLPLVLLALRLCIPFFQIFYYSNYHDIELNRKIDIEGLLGLEQGVKRRSLGSFQDNL